MAFAYEITKRGVIGDLRYVMGTYTNGAGDSGGDIDTGFSRVENHSLGVTGATVGANIPSLNETIPSATGVMTIVTDLDMDGDFLFLGQE